MTKSHFRDILWPPSRKKCRAEEMLRQLDSHTAPAEEMIPEPTISQSPITPVTFEGTKHACMYIYTCRRNAKPKNRIYKLKNKIK